ncbi:MAG TPA: hypothetical protein VLM37_01855 [Fibrobacteraceae bacterium]|nr:hypothetical protein [Fibrobacteraceae bacterium]
MSRRIFLLSLLFGVVLVGAATKTAHDYFLKGAYLYADAQYPTAAIETREGLTKYPADSKLQMLLKRIEEAMEKQKQENNKNNPGDNNDKQSSNSQGLSSNSQGDQGSSGNQGSSNSQQSSQSNQGQQPPDGGNSSAGASSSAGAQPPPDSVATGDLNRDQAEQLLKDFQEADKEHKRQLQMRGRAMPEKDW